MTAVNRDPVTIAREVLDMNEARDYLATADPLAVYSVGGERYAGLHVSEKIERRLREASPDLARAVIDLTAQLDAYREENTRYREGRARMEALADRLDDGHLRHLIRAALNGETRA